MSLFARKGKLTGWGRAAIFEAGGPTAQKTSLQGRDTVPISVSREWTRQASHTSRRTEQ